MGVYRTALVLGALTLSIPVFGQGSRSGDDRSRSDRGRPAERSDSRAQGRNNGRYDAGKNGRVAEQSNPRNDGRANRVGQRNEVRPDPRVRVDIRTVRPDMSAQRRDDRYERRDVRQDRRDVRYDVRDQRNDGRANYRYDGGEFRRRDVPVITLWFRNRGLNRAQAYGLNDRYDFRPGLYLSTTILARLDVLPFDLELQLGSLPWYLERRIYGRTVLVIDTRSGMLVDMYDIDG